MNQFGPLIISNPIETIALVPYLLGYQPNDRLVALGFAEGSATLAPSADLADLQVPQDRDAAAWQLVDAFTSHQVRQVVLVGYGAADRAGPALTAAAAAMQRDGRVEVLDALRVHDGRWWSVLTPCPAEGFADTSSQSPIVAHAIAEGLSVRPERELLRAQVAPPEQADGEAMQEAIERAQEHLASAEATLTAAGRMRARAVLIRDLYQRIAAGNADLDDQDAARLLVALTQTHGRDEAWIRISHDPDELRAQLEFWRALTCRVDGPYASTPALITAYAAYMTGDGVLANMALDRALAADPANSLAQLLAVTIRAGVPPTKVRAAMLTPDELTHAYEEVLPPDAD